MSDIYLYKNQLWSPAHDFRYTGEPEEFTLNPGKYLFICHGAMGGRTGFVDFHNRGGSSYGVMDLEQSTTMYAVVGGNGEDSVLSATEIGKGGYNGGGDGGRSSKDIYHSGAGGGGASDVRLTLEDITVTEPHSIPNEFEELEYVENNNAIAIRTGVIPLATTEVEADTIVYQSETSKYSYLFGCRNVDYGSTAQCLEFKVRHDNNPGFYWLINTGSNIQTHDDIYGERFQLKTHGSSVTVSQNGEEKFTMTSTEQRVSLIDNPDADIMLFNCNQNQSNGNVDAVDPGHVRLYSFKIYQNGNLSNYFVPCRTKNVDANIGNIEWENGSVGSSGDIESTTRVRVKGSIKWDASILPRQIAMYATDINGENLRVNLLTYDKSGNIIKDDYWYDSGHVFYVDPNTRSARLVVSYSDGRDISSEMVNNISIKYANGEIGLCDIVSGTFHSDILGTDVDPNGYECGEVVENTTTVMIPRTIQSSLLSRIIVAGGGGGCTHMHDEPYSEFCGFGGGINGGYPFGSSSMENDMKESTQTSGYAFGRGQSGRDRIFDGGYTYGMEGNSGGGGGWYGGYAPDSVKTSVTYSTANGGGGSGYVYTESSYKPNEYLQGYEDRQDLMFTDVFMDAGSSEESSIIICVPVSSYNTGDRIICSCVGEGNKFKMYSGKYTVKCYGGFGAHRYHISKASKGGYAQGTFSNPEYQDVFAYVGGSGTFAPTGKSATFTQSTFPTLCFNGGGNPSSFGESVYSQGEAAGGGTDLRIGTDSLLARIIVTGGGGGTGCNSSIGGAGGGTEGASYNGSGCGTNYGPGKQDAAGSGSNANISGGFGYGGNGEYKYSGYGGAGGGGWYGGSGTEPDGSRDDDYGGCGGSGYVLTETSFKPEGYLLDERYYMTDTVLTQGGNDLPIGLTKMIIECNEVHNALIICHDDVGYKSFDEEAQEWKYLKSEELTIEDFEEHGCFEFKTDAGLKTEYELYTYSVGTSHTSARFHVVPPVQQIKTKYYTPHTLTKCTIDADVDTENVEFSVTTKRQGIAEEAHIDFTITCNMKDVPNVQTRLYCIQGYTQGTTSKYVERKPKEKTLEHIDLLPVGTGNRMPSRYKSYIGGFINGNEAITTINSAVCCEHNRCIYSATLCNNKVVRFAKLNLITNTSNVIKDIPKSQIGDTYYGDILVDDDYIYLTSSHNDVWRTLWRISLNSEDTTVLSYTPGNYSDYNFNACGKMEWWDDHTIIILARKGILMFDTKTLKWTWKQSPSQNNERRDMIVGKKYVISLRAAESKSAFVCDVENNQWFELNQDLNIGWAGTYLNCGCYGGGKFYVTQQNRMHVIDEETMTLEKSIPTPYTNLTPKTAHYANGIIYITIQNSSTLYIYDTKTDRFTAVGLPFTMDNWTRDGWMRGVSFRGYFFIPNIRLYVINYVEYAKYNIGYKYDQFIMITNKDSAEQQPYEYDDRFVTFMDSNMWIHTGDIISELEPVNEDGSIKKCLMNKNQYNKLLSCLFVKLIRDENDNE